MKARRRWIPYVFAICLCAGTAEAAHASSQEVLGTSYDIGQTGSVTDLGIRVEVSPDVGENGILGFVVSVVYKDPTIPSSRNVVVLAPTMFRASCENPMGRVRKAPITWWNERGVGFAVELSQRCHGVKEGLVVPVLEAQLSCSEAEEERRYVAAMEEGRLFDIAPAGSWKRVENDLGQALSVAQMGLKVVSTVLTVLDMVAVSRGALTAGRFVMRLVVGTTVGELIDSGLEYAKTTSGYKVIFDHEGWDIKCRLCGTVFHRDHLTDGETLRCPRSSCRASVTLQFD